MKNRIFAAFANQHRISDRRDSLMNIAVGIFLSLLITACGGGKGDNKSTPSSKVVAVSSAVSSVSSADVQRPTISAVTANVLAESIVVSVVASDNVGVTSVTFLVDGDALKDVDEAGSDGTFSTSFPHWVRGVGTHHFVAIALDAAGNTTSSEEVVFVVADNAEVANDFTPPTVSDIGVTGNFGLIRLKAIAKDNVGVGLVEFLVDDKLTGYALPNPLTDAPAGQYHQLFDTSLLSSGPHRLVARVRDGKNQVVLSNEANFIIEPTAGLSEIEPNNDQGSANIVADSQLQAAGRLTNTSAKADADYYKVKVLSREKLTATLLSTKSEPITVHIYDSNGAEVSIDRERNLLGDESVSYFNDAGARYVYVRVTSEPKDFKMRNQYRLALGYISTPDVDKL